MIETEFRLTGQAARDFQQMMLHPDIESARRMQKMIDHVEVYRGESGKTTFVCDDFDIDMSIFENPGINAVVDYSAGIEDTVFFGDENVQNGYEYNKGAERFYDFSAYEAIAA